MPDSRTDSNVGDCPSCLPIVFIVVNIVSLYVIYMLFHCLPLLANKATAGQAFMEVCLFNGLTAMIVFSYLRACLTNPGRIPSKADGDMTWEYRTMNMRTDNSISSMLGLGLNEVKQTGERRHCKWCAKYKPDRTHHCRVCRTCVLKMDHHCPWIGNCVGFHNHKYFFLTLFYSTLATNLIIWTMLDSVQTSVDTTVPFSTMFALIFGETLAGFLALVVTVFFIFHIWLMLRAMTTIEFCEKSMKRNWDTSVYNRGIYGNICAVLGDNPLLWLLPLSPPSGDGINFSQTENVKLMEGGRGMRQLKMKTKAPRHKRRGVAGTGEYYPPSEVSGPETPLTSTTSLPSVEGREIDNMC